MIAGVICSSASVNRHSRTSIRLDAMFASCCVGKNCRFKVTSVLWIEVVFCIRSISESGN